MDMEALRNYFENTEGTSILATAESTGQVDAAVYARPHIMDDGTIAMIMLDRLSHHNLESNPHACYLFMEAGGGYQGKRLYLTKVREELNSPEIEKLRRHTSAYESQISQEDKYLVYFQVEKELPLIGSGK